MTGAGVAGQPFASRTEFGGDAETRALPIVVITGLDPVIHAFCPDGGSVEHLDGRNKSGHDD